MRVTVQILGLPLLDLAVSLNRSGTAAECPLCDGDGVVYVSNLDGDFDIAEDDDENADDHSGPEMKSRKSAPSKKVQFGFGL